MKTERKGLARRRSEGRERQQRVTGLRSSQCESPAVIVYLEIIPVMVKARSNRVVCSDCITRTVAGPSVGNSSLPHP